MKADSPSFAIVHLYATGSYGSKHGLLQVGVLSLQKGNAVLKEWFINPEAEFGRSVQKLSKISKEQAKSAPLWQELKAEVQEYLSTFTHVFFFHERHEQTWLKHYILAGMPTPPICADLAVLSSFFLPHLNLMEIGDVVALSTAAQKKPASQPMHVALAALHTQLFKLLEVLLQKISSTPEDEPGEPTLFMQLLRQVLDLGTVYMGSAWRTLQAAAEHIETLEPLDLHWLTPLPTSEVPVLPFHLRELLTSWLPTVTDATAVKPRVDIAQPSDQLVHDALHAWYKKHGLPERYAQMQYAQFCNKALTDKGTFVAEAGTGTGKTMGYLIAAAELLRLNPGRKVVVATATKNLQEQVMQGEIPRLRFKGGLHSHLRPAIVKGKNNYVCVSALLDLYDELVVQEKGTIREGLSWLYLVLRVHHTQGEVEEIPHNIRAILPDTYRLLMEANAQEVCVPKLCQEPAKCTYAKHMELAYAADIIVTNHHKLLQLPPKLTDLIKHCIIDEADQFPDFARSALSMNFSLGVVEARLLRPLLGKDYRKGFLDRVAERVAHHVETETAQLVLDEIDSIHRDCATIRASGELIQALPIQGEQRWQEEISLEENGRWVKREFSADIEQALQELLTAIQFVAGKIDRILKLLKQPEDKTFSRLETYKEKAAEFADSLQKITSDFPARKWIHVLEKSGQNWSVSKMPYYLQDEMEKLQNVYPSLLFTSATLYVGGNTQYFRNQLGRQEPFAQEVRYLSPFNYEQQEKVHAVVPAFIPCYEHRMAQDQKQAWLQTSMETLLKCIVALNGRTLVLFTSRRDMEDAYRWLHPRLPAYDIELLKQEGTSLWEIRRFRQEEHSVLLGLDRMWSGVDFPGVTLSQVIVFRLPNPSLGNPLVAHRREVEGGFFWSKFYYPASQHKLRQGFGRLVRREKDKGAFVILDSRVHHTARMQHLKDELPVDITPFHAGAEMENWLLKTLLPKLELASEWERRGVSFLQS
ncbi:ATP-dependent DNA helicase [Rufibacter latericius]|uniref:ATP-dependent DNA helicase n=1 Tax=Rufibacter latericius TaxID=2487040 RepID=A0A3M9MPZ5_9BACT|nr:ATP-dependent DNA helicase [Rufibacter latericius]RNI26768.1 ATP-dependent DNA helicase [Rufibacter latericius]